MYHVWLNGTKDNGGYNVQLIHKNIATLEKADDIAKTLTLTRDRPYIALLVGGKAEPIMQERARWTCISERMPDFDDAGCDWLVIGDETYIADIDWLASTDPEVARLVTESYIYKYGDDAGGFVYANKEEYYQHNGKPEEVQS